MLVANLAHCFAGRRFCACVDERTAVVAGRGKPFGHQREDPEDALAGILPPGGQDLGNRLLPVLAARLEVGADELVLRTVGPQADVRRVAQQVKDRYDHVDILINNAGNAFNRREQSADGLELTWATNQLAPFLLTELLLPLLVRAPAGRVVNLTTEVYSRRLDLDNLEGDRKYSWMGAYRISKLGVVLFTTELARRIKGSGVTVVSVSPGPTKTNFGGGGPSGVIGLVTDVLKHTPLLKTADQAAEGIAWAATAPELADHPGALYMRHKQLSLKGAANDPHGPGSLRRT